MWRLLATGYELASYCDARLEQERKYKNFCSPTPRLMFRSPYFLTVISWCVISGIWFTSCIQYMYSEKMFLLIEWRIKHLSSGKDFGNSTPLGALISFLENLFVLEELSHIIPLAQNSLKITFFAIFKCKRLDLKLDLGG